MLFDLRGRGRRRVVQVIYLFLAVILGGGLIFFGIGGGTNGGLFDALKSNNGSSGAGSGIFDKRVKNAEKAIRVNPRDAAAWFTLTKAHVQLASVGSNFDQNSGNYTSKGLVELRAADRAWIRYNALDSTPVAGLAAQMVNAYVGLADAKKAAGAQQIVVDDQPNAGQYSKLAQLAFAGGLTRLGDLSTAKAIELAPKDQKSNVKDALAQAKTQGAAALSGGQQAPGG